jgi:hypothetical protein
MHADAFYEWKVVEGGKKPHAIAFHECARFGSGLVAPKMRAMASAGRTSRLHRARWWSGGILKQRNVISIC